MNRVFITPVYISLYTAIPPPPPIHHFKQANSHKVGFHPISYIRWHSTKSGGKVTTWKLRGGGKRVGFGRHDGDNGGIYRTSLTAPPPPTPGERFLQTTGVTGSLMFKNTTKDTTSALTLCQASHEKSKSLRRTNYMSTEWQYIRSSHRVFR